jgi:uncharacterized protein YbaR (Trm112 family)
MEDPLLEILCAPVSHARLRLASPAELRHINSQIRSRLVRNQAGLTVDVELEGCLVCEADRTCYPIRDGFPVLISGEAFDSPPNLVSLDG